VDRPVSFDRGKTGPAGEEVRLAFAPDAGGDRFQDPSLIKLIVQATPPASTQSLRASTLAELAAEQGYTRDYFAVLLRLSYLAPDITQPFWMGGSRCSSIANAWPRGEPAA